MRIPGEWIFFDRRRFAVLCGGVERNGEQGRNHKAEAQERDPTPFLARDTMSTQVDHLFALEVARVEAC
jgi:hypothetical protein